MPALMSRPGSPNYDWGRLYLTLGSEGLKTILYLLISPAPCSPTLLTRASGTEIALSFKKIKETDDSPSKQIILYEIKSLKHTDLALF